LKSDSRLFCLLTLTEKTIARALQERFLPDTDNFFIHLFIKAMKRSDNRITMAIHILSIFH